MTHGGSGKGKGMSRRSYPGDPRVHVVPTKKDVSGPGHHRYFDWIADQERMTLAERKKEAEGDWKDLRGRIFSAGGGGGIRPVKTGDAEEYPEVPRSLWRHNAKFSIDHFANEFGFDYPDDFAKFAETVYDNYKDISSRKATKPRKLPKIRHTRAAGRGRIVSIVRKPKPVPQAAKTEIRRCPSR